MEWAFYAGTIAGVCTTGAFVPQILKMRKQGGEDLSYAMLFIYLTGNLFWLLYGLLLHAAEVIWANSITSLLVITALALKATYSGRRRSKASLGGAAAREGSSGDAAEDSVAVTRNGEENV